MGKGSGFGKVILFNEHYVVYGIPGIVSAIDSSAYAEVKKVEGSTTIKDERKGSKGYTEKKRTQQKDSINRMLRAMNLDPQKVYFEICLGGNLPGFSGIGASAASSVAIARAIVEELNFHLSNEEINDIAYEAEKAYAGTPSGIDNTAATFGGLIWFVKSMDGRQNTIERLSLVEPVEIVIGNTGLVADTKQMVADVAIRKSEHPKKYDRLLKQAYELVITAREVIESFNMRRLGELMNENHLLLQELGVSCKELDFLVNLARERGAYGAKLTGGGGGGCMIALTPGNELQEKVASTFRKEGFKVLKTKIGIKNAKKN